MSLILPPGYQKRSNKIDPSRFRGYARHKCGAEAFWFTRFGKAWFDLDVTEVYFEDGQIKLQHHDIEEYRCPHCASRLKGEDLKLIKIIQQDEADAMHRAEHRKTPIGQICEFCGERRKSGAGYV